MNFNFDTSYLISKILSLFSFLYKKDRDKDQELLNEIKRLSDNIASFFANQKEDLSYKALELVRLKLDLLKEKVTELRDLRCFSIFDISWRAKSETHKFLKILQDILELEEALCLDLYEISASSPVLEVLPNRIYERALDL